MTADRSDLLARFDVSRETIDQLQVFSDLLAKWNPKINLVSRSSLDDMWNRHIVDSIQVFRCVSPAGHWVDLGSGGGLPGAIVGIIALSEAPDLKVTLVESDQRKSVFLRTVARETGAKFTVMSERIEKVPPLNADILSARALANLSTLLEYSDRHLSATGVGLFPKGVNWEKEVTDARQRWHFQTEPITSVTEPGAVILKVLGVSRV